MIKILRETILKSGAMTWSLTNYTMYYTHQTAFLQARTKMELQIAIHLAQTLLFVSHITKLVFVSEWGSFVKVTNMF